MPRGGGRWRGRCLGPGEARAGAEGAPHGRGAAAWLLSRFASDAFEELDVPEGKERSAPPAVPPVSRAMLTSIARYWA